MKRSLGSTHTPISPLTLIHVLTHSGLCLGEKNWESCNKTLHAKLPALTINTSSKHRDKEIPQPPTKTLFCVCTTVMQWVTLPRCLRQYVYLSQQIGAFFFPTSYNTTENLFYQNKIKQCNFFLSYFAKIYSMTNVVMNFKFRKISRTTILS